MMSYELPAICPVCKRRFMVTRLSCKKCGSSLEGDFELDKLSRLSESMRSFIISFLKCRGSIREMEREYGISYPTVRARIDEIVTALGENPTFDGGSASGAAEFEQRRRESDGYGNAGADRARGRDDAGYEKTDRARDRDDSFTHAGTDRARGRDDAGYAGTDKSRSRGDARNAATGAAEAAAAAAAAGIAFAGDIAADITGAAMNVAADIAGAAVNAAADMAFMAVDAAGAAAVSAAGASGASGSVKYDTVEAPDSIKKPGAVDSPDKATEDAANPEGTAPSKPASENDAGDSEAGKIAGGAEAGKDAEEATTGNIAGEPKTRETAGEAYEKKPTRREILTMLGNGEIDTDTARSMLDELKNA